MSTYTESEQKAQKYYEEAMKLDPEDHYSKEAEELLQKALKLNDTLADGYTALGYIVLQKRDGQQEAVKLFEKAVQLCQEGKRGDKAEALCGLSVAVRYGMANGPETEPLFDRSVQEAKSATQADIESGKAWYTLGMAYLMRFFHGRRHPKDLNDALSAFQIAEKKPKTPLADLYINRGNVFQFLASIHNARADFEQARKLRPSNSFVQKQLTQLERFFNYVHKVITQSNVPKSKLGKLPTDTALLTELNQEKNPDKILAGVVMECPSLSDDTPQLFICADRNDNRFLVALYDVTADAVPNGATIQIAAPRLAPYTWDGKVVLPLIVVDNIGTVTVNKKPIPSDMRALPTVD